VPPLSAEEELQLSDAVATYFRILQFDRAWTALATRTEDANEGLTVLLEIARELRRLIPETVEAARTVMELAERTQPPSGLSDDVEWLPDVAAAYVATVDVAGGVAQLARVAHEQLAALADVEISTLDAELEALFGGGVVAGDLSRKFICGVAHALMVAGGVTVWIPPHGHAVASVAAGVAIAKANRCWELDPMFAKLGP
jgi:hypothetical protein